MALSGDERTVHTVAIQLAGPDVGQITVPDHVGLLGQRNHQRLGFRLGRIEQAQLYASRMFGEQREVDADAIPGGTEWVGSPRPDSH